MTFSSYTDTGIRGATGQSWRAANPRDLLKRVIDDHPGADRTALFRFFMQKLNDDDDREAYVETIIEYWFANNYHSLIAAIPNQQSAVRAAASREALVSVTKERLQQAIVDEAKIVLSEMLMPNGRRLADCTGQDCAAFSRKFGSLFGKITRRVKPEETVGSVLSEDDLQALYQKRA